MFFIIGVLINFEIFTGKHLCWSLFCVGVFLLKRDSNTGTVNFAKFLRVFFLQTRPVPASGLLLNDFDNYELIFSTIYTFERLLLNIDHKICRKFLYFGCDAIALRRKYT